MVMRFGTGAPWLRKMVALTLGLNWMMISVLDSWRAGKGDQRWAFDEAGEGGRVVPLPAFNMKGTPVHLSF